MMSAGSVFLGTVRLSIYKRAESQEVNSDPLAGEGGTYGWRARPIIRQARVTPARVSSPEVFPCFLTLRTDA